MAEAAPVPKGEAPREATESPPRITGRAEVVDVTEELAREHANVRPRLAIAILVLLGGTILLHAGMLATLRWTGLAATDVSAIFNTTFTGLMTLAGTAIGFYFGDVRGRQQRAQDSGGGDD